jgi:amidohydrolase
MHACGHDSHMTILLGLAKIMSTKKDTLPGNIKLFFQPSEEKDGGARRMIEAGCMENPHVDGVFFSHCTSTHTVGTVQVRSGATSAASDGFRVTFTGVGCHGAYPNRGTDSIVAACQVVTALQTISSRRNSPADPVVVTVGTIHAGTAGNIIPGTCEITGTIRTVDPKTRLRVREDFKQIVTGIANAMGVEADIFIKEGYAATVNNDDMVALTRAAAAKVLGDENVYKTGETTMGGEDFAYFCEAAPGCNFRLGVNSAKTGNASVHNATFMVDMDALPIGTAVYAQIAMDFLREE